jgi:RhtX/FptX family siderophore transporter
VRTAAAARTLPTFGKLGLLGSLYLSQGLPFGFFTQALPVLMRQAGYSLRTIGLSSLLALPWAGKFLWAPAVDRYGSARFGRRRSWIVPLQIASALTMLALGAAGEAQIGLLVFGAALTNLLCATQDIATDALAVDMLEHGERGLANGVQVAGYRVGMIFGGGFLLLIFDRYGFRAAFSAMAATVLLASVPIALHAEAPPRLAAQGDDRAAARAPYFLSRPGAWQIVLLLVLYKSGESFAAAMLRPFLADRGLGLGDIGLMLGTVGFVAGLLGALTGGALVGPLGRRRALVLFGLLQTAALVGYAAAARLPLGRSMLYALCAVEHFGSGTATATLFTCMMDFCAEGSSATDYTVQASAVVIATGFAASVSGYSAQRFGYYGHFLGAIVISLVAVAAAGAISRPFQPSRP